LKIHRIYPPLFQLLLERFTADKNVLKSNGTEVAGADGVPLVFKMKQLKGVSIHPSKQKRWKKREREYFT